MKKVLLLCIFIFLCPIIVFADEIEITRIELFEQTPSVIINSSPEYDGLKINIDHSFDNINDTIKYKIYIQNNQIEDYILKLANNDGKYVSYEISDDVIKGDSLNTVILTLKYKNEYKNLTSTFHDKNTIEFSFITKDSTTLTAKAYLPFAIVSFVVYSIIIFTKNRKMWYTSPLLGIILFGIYSFPISFADKKITVDSSIHLLKTNKCNSFKNDTWEMIEKNISKNEYSCYKIGDTKEIELKDLGKFEVRIVNLSTPEECKKDGFNASSCGFIVEFVSPVKELTPGTGTKDFLDNKLINILPTDLKKLVSKEKIYIPSLNEIGLKNDLEIEYKNTRTLDYYLLDTKEYSKENYLVRDTKDSSYIYVDKTGIAKVLDLDTIGIKPSFKLN